MKLPDAWSQARALFDDENLVSCAGLMPVMALAELAGLFGLISSRGRDQRDQGEVGWGESGGQADLDHRGDCTGADSIDDLDVIRCGAIPSVGPPLLTAMLTGSKLD